MSDVQVDGSIHDYGLKVLEAVTEIVSRTTGGNVRMDFVRDGDDDFAFAIIVNDEEWCTCHYMEEDGEAKMVTHQPMRDAVAALGLGR